MKYLNKSFAVPMPCHVSDEDWERAFSHPKEAHDAISHPERKTQSEEHPQEDPEAQGSEEEVE